MPQDLLTDAAPCAKQVELMESHGFQYDRETDDPNSVTWRGHGLTLVMLQSGVFSPAALTRLIVLQSRRKLTDQLRRQCWNFLGLRPLAAPVPFELVEMDLKTGD